jgi:hypothetical protein
MYVLCNVLFLFREMVSKSGPCDCVSDNGLFDIEIDDEDYVCGSKKLLSHLRESWSPDDIHFTVSIWFVRVAAIVKFLF